MREISKEQNLRYDYLEDPSNQELGQIELIEDSRIIAAREQSRMGNKFPVKKYKNFISHSEVTGADKEKIYIYTVKEAFPAAEFLPV